MEKREGERERERERGRCVGETARQILYGLVWFGAWVICLTPYQLLMGYLMSNLIYLKV